MDVLAVNNSLREPSQLHHKNIYLSGDDVLGIPETFDGKTQKVEALLKGRTGIIYFESYIEDDVRSSQARHIDLWNGSGINGTFLEQVMDATKMWF